MSNNNNYRYYGTMQRDAERRVLEMQRRAQQAVNTSNNDFYGSFNSSAQQINQDIRHSSKGSSKSCTDKEACSEKQAVNQPKGTAYNSIKPSTNYYDYTTTTTYMPYSGRSFSTDSAINDYTIEPAEACETPECAQKPYNEASCKLSSEKKEKSFLSNILTDPESLLICAILFLVISENADMTLILALLYLLI